MAGHFIIKIGIYMIAINATFDFTTFNPCMDIHLWSRYLFLFDFLYSHTGVQSKLYI